MTASASALRIVSAAVVPATPLPRSRSATPGSKSRTRHKILASGDSDPGPRADPPGEPSGCHGSNRRTVSYTLAAT